MSKAAKATLAATTAGALGIVVFVHYAQKSEKAAMHAGVIRDLERQERVQLERRADFEMSKKLEEEYRKMQTIDKNATENSEQTAGR